MSNKTNNQDERAKEFLSCLGNGKTIYQCEEENDVIDEMLKVRRNKNDN